MKTKRRKLGSAYLVVILFAAVMFILMMGLEKFRSGAIALLSKGEKDYLSTTIGEAGINCILSEMRVDPDYKTHELYKVEDKEHWSKPTKSRPTSISKKNDLYVSGVTNGIYGGGTQFGEFKIKSAKVFGKNDTKTWSLVESQMYIRIEGVSKVGDNKKPDEDAYRRLTVTVEKRSPASEFLLFDGEILDLGIGPYEAAANVLERGRLYGYQWITFTTAGSKDRGTEIRALEKMESPGMIRAQRDTPVKFSNDKEPKPPLGPGYDSANYDKFNPYGGYMLDGSHGAHSIKLTALPKEYYLEKAKKKNQGGFIIEKGTFPASKWKNPYDPGTEYVDLDFRDYRVGMPAPPEDPDPDNPDDEGEDPPPDKSDDPLDIATTKGKYLKIYSKVPLRIWGCPDRTIAIFSEKDIVIGGDFNQNPETVQDYPETSIDNPVYMNYKTKITNGKDNNKVGANVLSLGRIFVDVSRPSLFAKNEIRPYFLYRLAQAMKPNIEKFPDIDKDTRKKLCPPNPKNRQGIVGLSTQIGDDGKPIPYYHTLGWLFTHPNETSGPLWEDKVKDLSTMFTPGGGGLGIKDEQKRMEIILEIDHACRMGGDLTREELDRIFDLAWKQVVIEEEAAPDPKSGAMGMLSALFDEAKKDYTDGIFSPEITINASLVSSTRRSSAWKVASVGDSVTTPLKTFDEIGNAPVNTNGIFEYLKKPRFIIQRVYGSEIRLATAEPTYFVSGTYSGTSILRRRIWDRTLTGTSAGFQPPWLPFSFNILTYRDETITKKEYETF